MSAWASGRRVICRDTRSYWAVSVHHRLSTGVHYRQSRELSEEDIELFSGLPLWEQELLLIEIGEPE